MRKQSKQVVAIAVACGFLWGNSLSGEAAETITAAEQTQTQPLTKQEPVATENTVQPAEQSSSIDKTTAEVAKADTAKDAKKAKKAKNQSDAPVTITADELYMSDSTGDVYAKGNVKMVQGSQQLLTDLLNGNTNQQELWIVGQADYTNTAFKAHLDAMDTRYNYQTKEGTMAAVKGKVDHDIISGESVVMAPTEIVIHNGTVTRCPAKVPDYHMSAERIEMWPGQKMIAYNAKFWIGKFVIYSLPVYEQSLEPGAQAAAAYPSVGYSSKDGLRIKQKFEMPVGKNLYGFFNMNLYTNAGFKPNGGFSYRQSAYSVDVIDGYYRDDDGNWIKKQPEFDFNLYSHRMGSSPISYTFNAVYGQWSDSSKTSWHQEYNLYFSHDVIHLNNKNDLSLGTGMGMIHESYDNSTIHDFKFDTTLTHTFNDRWSTWLGYHYRKTQDSLFAYNRPDMNRELDTGFSYKIDNKNTFKYSQSYDLGNNHIYDQDYTWVHDLHCWEGSLTYRARRDQWKFNVSLKRW
jgi:lipopolysaccharide export system protein LptA